MHTTEVSARPIENTEAARVRFDLLGAPARLWHSLARKVQERRTLHKLYQLDARLLRDMGFDPDAIYEAYEGSIGATFGDSLREILKR
jgi:uncharacterized protein YjiS (DUF1127 family)